MNATLLIIFGAYLLYTLSVGAQDIEERAVQLPHAPDFEDFRADPSWILSFVPNRLPRDGVAIILDGRSSEQSSGIALYRSGENERWEVWVGETTGDTPPSITAPRKSDFVRIPISPRACARITESVKKIGSVPLQPRKNRPALGASTLKMLFYRGSALCCAELYLGELPGNQLGQLVTVFVKEAKVSGSPREDFGGHLNRALDELEEVLTRGGP